MTIKIKQKFGVCDVRKHALDDKKKRRVFWDRQNQMWICENCYRDVVLTAMATTNRKITKRKKINKN